MSLDPCKVQLTADGRLKHFLTTEGLSKELLTEILDTADSFISTQERDVKKVPLLRGKTVVNLFFENSTRTRATFELAAKRLSPVAQTFLDYVQQEGRADLLAALAETGVNRPARRSQRE